MLGVYREAEMYSESVVVRPVEAIWLGRERVAHAIWVG